MFYDLEGLWPYPNQARTFNNQKPGIQKIPFQRCKRAMLKPGVKCIALSPR
ncbi:hypothetical protein Cflav_PD3103 [Pedosphaera parvula Ellin514]|uniref:Uncharacterized protein n=1 Tax=Pedosphaera parvula (strain Ellin514) TaxID=320771 RepID=B9XJI3_PEDPL|nr:hypothetical protein Cflav_PD3103 [Pedosphaera parvula Ellin514]